MKSTLLALTLASALTSTSIGQVDVFPLADCCDPWDTSWDGTTLSFFQTLDCNGYTVWDFVVYEETTVTYQVEWLSCVDNPRVLSFDGIAGGFTTIQLDWYDQGGPPSWSGTFTIQPGAYEEIYFSEFQGTLTFGSGCVSGTDTDGDGVDDCDDGCPEDPFKSGPGDCGCGVEDLDSDKDGVADCNDGCPTDPDKTDPGSCGCGNEDTDTDGDGTADCVDICPDDPAKTDPGFCGCGTVDTNVNGDVDCDGDYDIDDAIAAMEDFDLGRDDCPSDVNVDGVVDFYDLLHVCHDWGVCP